MMSFLVDAAEGGDNLRSKLEEIAAKGNGRVPLHGRLFSQWLHYAFPYECPYPLLRAEVAKAKALVASKGGEEASDGAKAEKEKYLRESEEDGADHGVTSQQDRLDAEAEEEEDLMSQWTM